jgi:hypothetical protein
MRWRSGLFALTLVLCAQLATARAARLKVITPTRQFWVGTVRAGQARFEVITPTLIRLEYAQGGHFENGPTTTVVQTGVPNSPFLVRRTSRTITLSTSGGVTLTYRLHSGPFSASNLTLNIGKNAQGLHPTAANPTGNLGGWRRALDLLSGPVPLNKGLLSTAGWFVLDDSATALRTGTSFAAKPKHAGPYQDWYLFAYGHDYQRGLRDLRALTGPTPLLPRSAFGVWFSRYWPYSESDYHALLAAFRANRVPLDTLSIDTDFKRELNPAVAAVFATLAGAPGRPYSWDSWEWNSSLFPDPRRFTTWAHRNGLSLAVNIHPSISSDDPRYTAANSQAGGLATSSGTCQILMADPTAQCHVFDWTKPRQLAGYFALHRPFALDGVDFFWLDWCCDASRASAPGLTADTWINEQYANEQRLRGSRWPAFSRVGASYSETLPDDGDGQNGGAGIFAEHRYSIQFTGDTCATWPMLAFEARLSASEGNVGLPYVSDDIGSFNGQPTLGQCSAQTGLLNEHLPDDMYARWVALGTFQPLDRLHSNHGDRLPWEYGAAADRAAAGFLRLREALNPYIYTLARETYDSGLPITGALYLSWPRDAAAYRHSTEYTFGRNVVVAPVTSPGDPAPASFWVPPGRWVDFFTGRIYAGPAAITVQAPLSRIPVLIRAGAVLPTAPYADHAGASPASLILTAYPGARGSFRLYDDQGTGFGYTRGRYSWTSIVQSRHGRHTTLVIGPASGHFAGQPRRRTWLIRLSDVAPPRVVEINRHTVGRARWSYERGTLTISTGLVPIDQRLTLAVR